MVSLKKATGNMYSWNPVRGKCPYQCSYCFVGRWGKQPELHLDEKELHTDMGEGNVIFVCSGCDLFHPSIPDEWIKRVMSNALANEKNQYLWHTKNPLRVLDYSYMIPGKDIVCATIETNRAYRQHMGKGIASPVERAGALNLCRAQKMITIEPVMDFDIVEFAAIIDLCKPCQVNIGADSGWNRLREPDQKKLSLFIDLLETRTKVHLKDNLRRILPEHRLYENSHENLPTSTAKGCLNEKP
jgi:hypothetical protein